MRGRAPAQVVAEALGMDAPQKPKTAARSGLTRSLFDLDYALEIYS